MSGGVDSSVTALLLKKQGYQVEGVSLLLFERRGGDDGKSCCSLETVRDAAETARIIGIGHRVINARNLFIEKVITPFAEEYARGLTPNPCILCNMHVKFPVLMQAAAECGAEFIATGHYARVEREAGRACLKRAADERKDQSYVLYAQKKEELERLLLPLGPWRKKDVRGLAETHGLPVFNRPESQEICFVEGRDYTPFVGVLAPEARKAGPIFDPAGKVLGEHRGIYAYTLGQRKGIGVASPEPLYVYRIDPDGNAIYVGPRELALKGRVTVAGINWLMDMGGAGFRAGVKVRSMMEPAPALVTPSGMEALVEFDGPQWAPAPGQSAVFYVGDTVAGGGIIAGVE